MIVWNDQYHRVIRIKTKLIHNKYSILPSQPIWRKKPILYSSYLYICNSGSARINMMKIIVGKRNKKLGWGWKYDYRKFVLI